MALEEVCKECQNTNGEHKPGCSKSARMTPDREAAIVEAIKALPDEQGGFCRDCADEDGFCPNRKMPCTVTVAELKALVARYDAGASASRARVEALEKALREFVETMQTYHGCSDLGCPYKTPPNQQGTNGGCGCNYNAAFGGHVRNFFLKAKAALR